MRCGKITLALCVALASCMTMAEVGSAMGPGLRGERVALLWCRDKANTWEGELVRGESPATISGEKIPFSGSLRCYLPWENRWVEADSGVLPDFSRSIVVRFERSPEI